MKYPMLEKHTKHREQVIKMFSSAFQEKMKYIKDMLQKKYVLVLSLIVFYHNRTTVVYKVIGYIIYSFIDNLICLDNIWV